MIAPLKADVVQAVAREIRHARYLSCTVTDEQLVERVVTAYLEQARSSRRPSPRRPQRPRTGART